MSSTNIFIHGTREEQKKAVRNDLGPVPEVTVDFMLKYIIPDSNVDVEATAANLVNQQLWFKHHSWSAFDRKSPRELAKPTKDERELKETEVFSRLQDIYANIISNTVFTDRYKRKPTLFFRQLPDSAPLSDTDVRTRPDCCGEFTRDQKLHTRVFDDVRFPEDGTYAPNARNATTKSVKGSQHWFDIAYIEEYKLGDSVVDLNDNTWKILWSLHQMMHVDHRRRFAFGLTIGNETSRIWFCCRQTVLVSEPFNFNQDGAHLVHLISSLAYATPTQLGYDPTMKLTWPAELDSWQYEIEVTSKTGNTQTYQTREIISDTSNNIRGRATRVYTVRPIDAEANGVPGTRNVILKDSWIDVNRAKEGDTLATLLKGASDSEKKLFLTVLIHGIVQINGKDDSTDSLILKGQNVTVIPLEARPKETIAEEVEPRLKSDSQSDHVLGELLNEQPDEPGWQATLKSYARKVGHHQDSAEVHPSHSFRLFVLYHEPKPSTGNRSTSRAGSSTKLSESDALPHHNHRQIVKQIVYSPKHHYRIVFEEAGQSLMSLAESNKATLAIVYQVIYDVTLALQFMAKKGYVHRDVSAGNIIVYKGGARLADLEFAKEYGAGQSAYIRTGTYSFMATEVAKGEYWFPTTSKLFAHNPLHDIESLWWVGVWCALWHHPSSDHEDYKGKSLRNALDLQEKLGQELFPTIFDATDNTRSNELHHEDTYHLYKYTHRHHSVLIQSLFVRLDIIRTLISAAHLKISYEPHVNALYFTETLMVKTNKTVLQPIYEHILRHFSNKSRDGTGYTILPLQCVINEQKGKNGEKSETGEKGETEKGEDVESKILKEPPPQARGRAYLNRACKRPGQNFDT